MAMIFEISIHPPLAGRDLDGHKVVVVVALISIHPPLAGRDVCLGYISEEGLRFQSTCPLRGGTAGNYTQAKKTGFQSTRPLRGGTHHRVIAMGPLAISIHPPLAGRDCCTGF